MSDEHEGWRVLMLVLVLVLVVRELVGMGRYRCRRLRDVDDQGLPPWRQRR